MFKLVSGACIGHGVLTFKHDEKPNCDEKQKEASGDYCWMVAESLEEALNL